MKKPSEDILEKLSLLIDYQCRVEELSMLLEKQRFDNEMSEICLKQKINEEKLNALSIDSSHKKNIKQMKKEHIAETDQLKSRISELIQLNQSLLQMVRKKANSDRNINNKKSHIGYLILDISQKQGNDGDIYHLLVLQTPFSIDFTLDEAKELLDLDWNTISGKFNLPNDERKSGSMNIKWHLNDETSYWEIAIISSEEIVYPDNMFFTDSEDDFGNDII